MVSVQPNMHCLSYIGVCSSACMSGVSAASAAAVNVCQVCRQPALQQCMCVRCVGSQRCSSACVSRVSAASPAAVHGCQVCRQPALQFPVHAAPMQQLHNSRSRTNNILKQRNSTQTPIWLSHYT